MFDWLFQRHFLLRSYDPSTIFFYSSLTFNDTLTLNLYEAAASAAAAVAVAAGAPKKDYLHVKSSFLFPQLQVISAKRGLFLSFSLYGAMALSRKKKFS